MRRLIFPLALAFSGAGCIDVDPVVLTPQVNSFGPTVVYSSTGGAHSTAQCRLPTDPPLYLHKLVFSPSLGQGALIIGTSPPNLMEVFSPESTLPWRWMDGWGYAWTEGLPYEPGRALHPAVVPTTYPPEQEPQYNLTGPHPGVVGVYALKVHMAGRDAVGAWVCISGARVR